ncbi:ABC transporter ATP-binding protein [bacterium]|nr:ABC transporter ATP-binding protein [bacterium]
MNDVRVEFDNVWKLFRKGHRARSLRDAVPAMAAQCRNLLTGKRVERELGVDEFYSLQGVSFQVRSGECLGIIGPNGAGKSTMLKCASRILRPNKGSVRVAGRVSALIEVGAGFHPDLTGRENVFLNGTILGMKRKEITDRFDEIVEFAGMRDFIDMPVKRYSSGMYARLGFAVAAFMEPDVLLIDEVLSVGDMAFSRRCEKKIKEIVSGDTTVLFISHNLAAVRTICDRVIVLSRGSVLFDGDPDEAIRVYHSLVSGGEGVPAHGHPDIERLRFTLEDAYGSPTTNAEPGDVLTLDAELTARNAIEEASIGFFIRDVNDTEVYACSMESLGVEPMDLAAGETLRVRFRMSANLVPGSYGIGSVLHGRPSLDRKTSAGRICFEHTPNRQQLAVVGGSEVRGSANLFAGCIASVEPSLSAVSSG